MKRFDFNNNNDDDEDEDFDGESDAEADELTYMIKQEFDSAQLEFNLLQTAIELARSSLFWRFRRRKTKLKMIGEIYESLYQILEGKEDAILSV